MAVKLRLTRKGKKKQPVYRVVAADSRSPRDGRFIEIIGEYDPRQEPTHIVIDNAKAVRWLREGAQPTETVSRLLQKSGAIDAWRSGADPESLAASAAGAETAGASTGASAAAEA